jgi:hypothetical protein
VRPSLFGVPSVYQTGLVSVLFEGPRSHRLVLVPATYRLQEAVFASTPTSFRYLACSYANCAPGQVVFNGG